MCEIEYHPLKPFLPENSRLLMLGSFPPAHQRWCMDFFYPNFINDMWRIFGIVFFSDKEHFVDNVARNFRQEDIISFLSVNGIALFDTASAVRRTKNTASDKDLEIVETTDIKALLRKVPSCVSVVTTGQKATEVLDACFDIPSPKVGDSVPFTFDGREMRHFRMPSSSRAYPLRIERKAEYYRQMFRSLNFLDN